MIGLLVAPVMPWGISFSRTSGSTLSDQTFVPASVRALRLMTARMVPQVLPQGKLCSGRRNGASPRQVLDLKSLRRRQLLEIGRDHPFHAAIGKGDVHAVADGAGGGPFVGDDGDVRLLDRVEPLGGADIGEGVFGLVARVAVDLTPGHAVRLGVKDLLDGSEVRREGPLAALVTPEDDALGQLAQVAAGADA